MEDFDPKHRGTYARLLKNNNYLIELAGRIDRIELFTFLFFIGIHWQYWRKNK